MAKKKPSFDMTKIKDFFFHKGERVGLGVAGAITLLLLVTGFLGISTRPPASANSPTWGKAFSIAADNMRQQIQTTRPPEADKTKQPVVITYKDAVTAPTTYAELFQIGIIPDDKRRNPPVMTVSKEMSDTAQGMQVDYLLAHPLVYKVEENQRKIWVRGGQPVKALEPKRMMVVSAAFPYAEQLNQFRSALRYEGKDQLKPEDRPRFLGIEVYRSEVVPKGQKQPNAIPLYVYDAEKDRTVVAPALDKFFRRMVIDTYNPAQLGSALGPNMVTPLPFLASIVPEAAEKYPKLNLTGFDQPEGTDDDPKAKTTKPTVQSLAPRMQPNTPGAAADKGSGDVPVPIRWSKLGDAELVQRLEGNYGVFDPYGKPEIKADAAGKDNAKPGFNPNFNPNFNFNQNATKQPTDESQGKLLARFIDIDLEVGKTYQYWIRVRVANPNFGTKDVAEMKLATRKELESGFEITPPVTIPEEMFYYAVDQLDLNGKKPRDVSDAATPLQVHRWIDWLDRPTDDRAAGDWIVAERLLVHRGDPLGRRQFLTDAPEWDWKKGKFVLGLALGKDKKEKPVPVPVDFVPNDRPPPVLVDFRGGRHDKYRLTRKPGVLPMKDESATELLILDADGKLLVRSSNDDSRDPSRVAHYNRWASRVKAVRDAGASNNKTSGRVIPGFGR